MGRISVIIPTYNRIDSLRRTFSYLEKSKLKPLEVLIIDQSNADFSKLIQTLCGEEDELNVVYIHLEKPSSTAARNVGIKMSKGDVLVFMDDDVDVDAETLSNVVDLFKDERLVMAGGLDKKDVYHNSKRAIQKWAICLVNRSLASEMLAIWRAEFMGAFLKSVARRLQRNGLWDFSLR